MAAPFFSTPFQPYVYQIMLKPQEKIVAKPSSMCFMSASIELENVYLRENEVGMWQWLFGKTETSIVLHNSGQSDGFARIAVPSLARILPPDAFLCSVNDVRISNTVHQRVHNFVADAEGENAMTALVTGPGIVFRIRIF